ncbi:MAG: c-type cytochrome biogenesis protein CcmI [Rhodospirillales bacterium]|jgi:cytochrome c-type biogenesis protein CcmH|nr:c-type cytochrome biogenesis protein CcmI [Rhodospirillales bacterium]HJO97118.1 c-type cytochrome biogenesis protein CcmI [Rhodospirillales bacterium]
MIDLWLAIALLTVVVVGLLVLPLVRPRRPMPPREEYDLAIYRDQLAEVERDAERGLLVGEQAAATRTELQRRILAAAEAEPGDTASAAHGGRTAVLALVVVLAGALGVYGHLGSPNLPGQPLAERRDALQAVAESRAEMERLIDSLAQKMKESPGNVEGWILLGRSYQSQNRYSDAAEAFRRATDLSDRRVDVLAAYGEARVLARDGTVDPEDLAIFEEILAKDPRDPRARYYIGNFKAQQGDLEGALQSWVDLIATSPADAPWLDEVRERIADAERQLDLEAGSVNPSPAAGAVAASPPKMDEATIRAMVDGLAEKLKENPDDLKGWLMLARSYEVLGEAEKARHAHARAEALKSQSQGKP